MTQEFDSIFHEETIVYEDKSDIQKQYARRIDNARRESKEGHTNSSATPRKMSKHYPKNFSRAEQGFTNSKSTRGEENWSKEDSDYVNDSITKGANINEERKQKRRESLKKANEYADKDSKKAKCEFAFLDVDMI